ncbi:hypothetical protein DL768_006635 [Monosporascus sp. mg162]|nr:hypothetical protein DL768_006635 [Monosporascus sp. mg162]
MPRNFHDEIGALVEDTDPRVDGDVYSTANTDHWSIMPDFNLDSSTLNSQSALAWSASHSSEFVFWNDKVASVPDFGRESIAASGSQALQDSSGNTTTNANTPESPPQAQT